jgi:hypothetical protein
MPKPCTPYGFGRVEKDFGMKKKSIKDSRGREWNFQSLNIKRNLERGSFLTLCPTSGLIRLLNAALQPGNHIPERGIKLWIWL